LTQKQIANKRKIALRRYERLESGQRSLSGTSFRVGIMLCALLNIEPRQLLEAIEAVMAKNNL
jgi:transcriptional regulator with XRE-family HTH domain